MDFLGVEWKDSKYSAYTLAGKTPIWSGPNYIIEVRSGSKTGV